MDVTSLTGAMAAISAAKELGKAAIGIRDFNESAPVIAKLNDQILNAQERLFELSTQLFTLQQQHFETTKELREIKETVSERSRYSLFALSNGNFAYRVNVTPDSSEISNPRSAEPEHYLCQPCFDKRIKAVLTCHEFYGTYIHTCPVCKCELHGRTVSSV